MSTLAAIAAARDPEMRIDALSYRNRAMNLQLVAPSVPVLDAFSRELEETRRFDVEIEATIRSTRNRGARCASSERIHESLVLRLAAAGAWIVAIGAAAAVVIIAWGFIVSPLRAEIATLRTSVDTKQRLLIDVARIEGEQPSAVASNRQGAAQTPSRHHR